MERKDWSGVRLIVVADEIASCEQNGLALPVLKQILSDCGFDQRYQVMLWSEMKAGIPAGSQPYALITLRVTQTAEELSRFAICVYDYDYDLQLPQGQSLPPDCQMLTYSACSDNADFTARNIRSFPNKGFAFEMVGVGVIGRIQLRNGSEQAVRGSLIAASAALTCGIPFAEVLHALNDISMGYVQQEMGNE